jgi:hypothetical protein
VLGIALLVVGIVFACNVKQCAERLAPSARPLPWWVKWPLTDDSAGYRVVRALVALMGIWFVLTSVG